MSGTKILAVAGKGGVGKTSLAAVMVKPDRSKQRIDGDSGKKKEG